MIKKIFIGTIFLLLSVIFFNIPALEAAHFEKAGPVRVTEASAAMKTAAAPLR